MVLWVRVWPFGRLFLQANVSIGIKIPLKLLLLSPL
jgi:hypothetical protein